MSATLNENNDVICGIFKHFSENKFPITVTNFAIISFNNGIVSLSLESKTDELVTSHSSISFDNGLYKAVLDKENYIKYLVTNLFTELESKIKGVT